MTSIALVLGILITVNLKSVGATPQNEHLKKISSSKQWHGEQFENQLPKTQASFLEMLYSWLRGGQNTTPKSRIPILMRDAKDFAVKPASGLRITWLGHSTLLLEIDGYTLLIDPVWAERTSPVSWMGPRRFHKPPLPLDQLPKIDVVVISHDHYDHLDYPTITQLGNSITNYIVPLGVGAHLKHWGVDTKRITELDWWEEKIIGKLKVVSTPARHFSGRSVVMANSNKTLWSGWAFLGTKHRVYYSGDTAMFPEFAKIGKKLGPFDATLFETGAYNQLWPDVHIGPEQAVLAHELVRGKLYIPVHWGTFNLAMHSWTEPVDRLLVAAESAGVSVIIPQPGQQIEPSNLPNQKYWWPTVPGKNAKQDPIVSSHLSSKLRAKIPIRR